MLLKIKVNKLYTAEFVAAKCFTFKICLGNLYLQKNISENTFIFIFLYLYLNINARKQK